MNKKPYHHGDLRTALLVAAEQEITDKGIEGFSLRKVAQRAEVSHAAPAHHFKDTQGLLTALAVIGYERLLTIQADHQARAKPDAQSQQAAAGLGYIDFAKEHNALFRLIFGSQQLNQEDPALAEASYAAFDHLTKGVTAISGKSMCDDPNTLVDIAATWAIAHGLADLISSGRLQLLDALPEGALEPALIEMFHRAFRPTDRS